MLKTLSVVIVILISLGTAVFHIHNWQDSTYAHAAEFQDFKNEYYFTRTYDRLESQRERLVKQILELENYYAHKYMPPAQEEKLRYLKEELRQVEMKLQTMDAATASQVKQFKQIQQQGK